MTIVTMNELDYGHGRRHEKVVARTSEPSALKFWDLIARRQMMEMLLDAHLASVSQEAIHVLGHLRQPTSGLQREA